jgi:hypothetical protein
MKKLLYVFFAVMLCLLPFISYAQSGIIFRPGPGLNDGTDDGSINAGKDTWVYGNETGTNYGLDPYILGSPVSDCNPATFMAYIQFNLSTLPIDVQQVFLGVTHLPHTSYCYSNCNADFYFYPVNQPWGERTLTYNNAPSEGSAVYGPINISFPNDFGNMEYDITTIYRNWQNNSVPNHGLAIHSPTVGCNNAAVIFYVASSDDPEESRRPYLRIIPSCLQHPSGLVSWWSGDGHPFDIAGTSNGTLMNGAIFEAGKIGQAFSFNGTSAVVDVADNDALDVTTEFTLASWVKPATVPTYPQAALVLSKIGSLTNLNGYQMAVTHSGENNIIWCGFNEGGNNWPQYVVTGGNVPVDEWSHIACTYNNNDLSVHMNGQLVGTNIIGPRTVVNTSSHLKIGSDDVGQQFYSGLIDEVQLFNRALSAEEIAAIYNAPGNSGMCKPCYAPPSGLVSWWTGDGNANDIVGTNHGAFQNGATITAGIAGQAFSFDGIDNYVSILDSASLDITDAISIGTWIYRRDNGHRGILSKGAIPSDGVYELAIYQDKFYFRLNGADLNMPSNAAIPVSTWTHVAGTYDGSIARIYINGVLDASQPYTAAINTDANPLNIGLYGNPTVFFNGLIDELEIFNRALSSEEVAAIHAAGSAGMCVPSDTIPDQFTFTDQTGVVIGTTIVSNEITVTGINVSTSISITGGEYSINGGVYTSVSGTVENNQTVRVRQTSSSSYSTITNATLTIGSVSDTFSVTTMARFTVTPESGTLGTVLEISGPTFGIKKGKVYLEKDGIRFAMKVVEWNLGGVSNLIMATVKKAPPAGLYRVILVSKEVGELSLDKAFEVMAPVVDSASVDMVEGKRVATILGNYFGYTKKPKVYFNNGTKDLSCKVTSTAGTEIRCYPHKSVVTGTFTVKVVVGNILRGERAIHIIMP